MAFTGDLEHLPIVDIIQLLHTTRKSGIFSVKSDKGQSKIVFSGGYIVGANHADDSVRIGSVLVKMGALSIDDLKQTLDNAPDAEKQRKPLLSRLVQSGKLKRDDALRGLKKLVEMTIVELMSWTKGTFTFDTDAVIFSSEGKDTPGNIEQDVVLDAQMVLMDALRIFDERERDRSDGKDVPSFEAMYADVLPREKRGELKKDDSVISADDLGLADLERLEKRIPRPVSEMEVFDPVAIHRQNIKQILAGFSPDEQEAFVSFLKKSSVRKAAPDAAAQQAGKTVVLFSSDLLLRHAVMTICKEEGIPVFATDGETDLERIIAQCISGMRTPMIVFDSPDKSDTGFSEEKIVALRSHVRDKYSGAPLIQLAPPRESGFILQSYSDGVRAVFPKPVRDAGRESYVRDTIAFLDVLKSYIKRLQHRLASTDKHVKSLKSDMKSLREMANPSDAPLVLLAGVAEMFERAVTFFVRPAELTGERAIGLTSEKSIGPTPADRLRIPLAHPSIFRDVIEKGQAFYGESSDEALAGLFRQIEKPVNPTVVLMPLICTKKVVAIVYGDFGKHELAPVQLDVLEVLAHQVGIVLECALYRRQATKATETA
jgi:hypothetical protein